MDKNHTISSSYADLVLEPTENGGVLIFVRQYHGTADSGEARINLSSEQAAELRQHLTYGDTVAGLLSSDEPE